MKEYKVLGAYDHADLEAEINKCAKDGYRVLNLAVTTLPASEDESVVHPYWHVVLLEREPQGS